MFERLVQRRVLVTGASGYIGAQVVARLEGAKVEYLATDMVPGTSPRHRQIDLRDRDSTLEVLRGFAPDVVVHCGTASALSYRDRFRECFRDDLTALENVLDGAGPGCRIVYFSSSYVASGRPPTERLDETAPLRPSHAFGVAKLFFEQFLRRVHPSSVVFRLCSVFGLGHGRFPNAVAGMVDEALASGRVTVWGRGTRSMQYVALDDVLSCIALAADVAPAIYNLGGDAYVTVADTAHALAAALDAEVVFDAERPEGETLPYLPNDALKAAAGAPTLFTPVPAALRAYAEAVRDRRRAAPDGGAARKALP